ncbi:PREDICTED: uncharacterized protein LOC109338340 [Lupinus angustifolius]|uniref:uncharacterized protein LOC109338340 n=1 Tax=Lupinus angustifolius TaxID=3871 RepID=UPI00092E4651|nr:PREDICTED: uncharacterized protein LOC109338340 [Lupinus angustifolius]
MTIEQLRLRKGPSCKAFSIRNSIISLIVFLLLSLPSLTLTLHKIISLLLIVFSHHSCARLEFFPYKKQQNLALKSVPNISIYLGNRHQVLCIDFPPPQNPKAEKNRFKGGSSSSKLKFSEYHVEFQGNKADKYGGDQVFGAEERKVYTGPNPLHNR